MKKIDFDISEDDLEDIDSDIAEMVRSLTFRNKPSYRSFRFSDEERHAKRKRNHRSTRLDEEIHHF